MSFDLSHVKVFTANYAKIDDGKIQTLFKDDIEFTSFNYTHTHYKIICY